MKKISAFFALAVFLVSISVFLVLFFSVYLVPSPPLTLSNGLGQAPEIKEGNLLLLEGDYTPEEIYQMIECPCCGQSIAANCCGMAKQRQDFVKRLYNAGLSKKELLLKSAKEFGMDSLRDESVKGALREELRLSAPADSPVIVVEPNTYDFGDVSVAGGKVFALADVKNEGKSDLIIDGLSTSCGCTSASLVVNGVEGPIFTMPGHGEKNPTGWSAAIAPGKTAKLKIYYDPTVHPDLRGPVTRTVSISSNSPVDFELKVKIEANQVD